MNITNRRGRGARSITGLAVVAVGFLGMGAGTAVAARVPATRTSLSAAPHHADPYPYEALAGNYPTGLPNGPVGNVRDCPTDPRWKKPLPPGATVSGPMLAPPGIMPHPVQGSAPQVSPGSNCDYQVTLANTSAGPTDPITYNYFGTVDQFLDTPEEWAVPNDYGSICYTTWDVGNLFGYGVAQDEFNSGYCNTTPGPLGAVAAVTSSGDAPVEPVGPNFGQYYQSYAPGTIQDGSLFQTCLENPVGQEVSYICQIGYVNIY